MNKLRIFLILLLFLLGGVDVYFALQNPELEANPGLIVLRQAMGLGYAWGLIIFMKFLILSFSALLVATKEFKSPGRFFFVLSLVILLIISQGYGIYTGIRASTSVTEVEDSQGYPLTQVQKQKITQDTSSVSLVQYNQSIFFISILPLLVANLSFWVFDKLKKDTFFGKRKKKTTSSSLPSLP